MTTDRGRPLYMIGVVADITAGRLTEEALRQSQKMDALGRLTGDTGAARTTVDTVQATLARVRAPLARRILPEVRPPVRGGWPGRGRARCGACGWSASR